MINSVSPDSKSKFRADSGESAGPGTAAPAAPAGASQASAAVLVSAHGIVKRFGERTVNDVDYFDVRTGEVHALLGENGAGKSTLTKILYGYYRPDGGEIRVGGTPVAIRSPAQARSLGIGMVFQDFTLIPALSVLENIALFMSDLPAVLKPALLEQQVAEIARRFHLRADLRVAAASLAVGDKQKVEILKQILAGARVLILDEPTKVLAPQERAGLFATIAELRAKGYGVVFITHKLGEVMEIADRVTVMRQGRIAGVRDRALTDEAELLGLMFAERGSPRATARSAAAPGRAVLQLEGISTRQAGHAVALNDVCFEIREGEILGVAGVSGSGQPELGAVVLGKQRRHRGRKLLCGENATGWTIARVRRAGVAFVPEDPLGQASFGDLTVAENFAVGDRRYRRGLGIDWTRVRGDLAAAFTQLRFPAPLPDARLRSLSGGNLQRVVIAREFATRPRLILAYYPTRGLDAHSAQAVRARLESIAREGVAVMLVSEDLDELFALSDRMVVLFQGRISGEFAPGEFDSALVGAAMAGVATGAAGGRAHAG